MSRILPLCSSSVLRISLPSIKGVAGATYLYFPSATIEMVGYLTLTLVASFLLRLLEKKN